MTILQNGRTILLAGLLVVGMARTGHTAAGDLDMSFSSARDFTEGEGFAVVVQKDGKSVVVGRTGTQFLVARYLTNGSPDVRFGTQGKKVIQGGMFNQFEASVIQPDGKIIAVGRRQDETPEANNMIIARLLTNGQFDTSFSGNGRQAVDFFGGFDVGSAVAVQPDGNILIAGSACSIAGCDFALVRLLQDGDPDPTFGAGGKVTTDFIFDDMAWGVALQPDNKIVVVGGADIATGGAIAVARYLPNGTLDPDFQGGRVVIGLFGYGSQASAVAIQQDGNILVAGTDFDEGAGGGNDMVVIRHLPSGVLDTTFGFEGIAYTGIGNACGEFGRCHDALAQGMTLDAAGRTVVTGVRWDITSEIDNREFALTRLLSTGVVDTSFGDLGYQTTDFGGIAFGRGAAAQIKDGKILMTGGNNGLVAVVRYHAQTCNGLDATRVGTADDDILTGTKANDVIVGFGGNDTISSGSGNDTICAGPGNDVVKGGAGNDLMKGGEGDDVLTGGVGTDTCDGGAHVVGDTASSCETVRGVNP